MKEKSSLSGLVPLGRNLFLGFPKGPTRPGSFPFKPLDSSRPKVKDLEDLYGGNLSTA